MAAPRVNCLSSVTSGKSDQQIPSTHNAEAVQVASTVFQVFSMTRPGIEPNLPASVALVLLIILEKAIKKAKLATLQVQPNLCVNRSFNGS